MFKNYVLEVIEFFLFAFTLITVGLLFPTVLCTASWFYVDKLAGTAIYLPVLLVSITAWVAIVIFCVAYAIYIFSKISDWLERYKR